MIHPSVTTKIKKEYVPVTTEELRDVLTITVVTSPHVSNNPDITRLNLQEVLTAMLREFGSHRDDYPYEIRLVEAIIASLKEPS